MARPGWYQRRYYYKNFKSGMDNEYRFTGISSLVLGALSGYIYGNFFIGLVIFLGSMVYHSFFISLIEPRLASFWGDGGIGCFQLLAIRILRWGLFFYLAYALLSPKIK